MDSYLGLRVDKNQVNLEIRKNKPDYNPAVFEQILAPHNYPLGRFPSNTKYALSLMQQIVVNLTSNVDTKNIRSVNGPPGTGKTTLLKDVFADLVVKQAMKMSETALLSGKLGDNMGELAELPNGIARNNIVVASSNNGALENIVNELPLEAEIDGTLITELKKVDYFMEIANEIAGDSGSNLSKWGLFSLAGGKYSNVKILIEALKKMLFYLESEYQPNFNVYKEYRELHHSVELLRNEVDAKANEYRNLPVNIQKLNMLAQKYESFEEKFENEEAQKRYLVQKKEADYRLLESQNKHKQAKLQLELLNLDSKITLNRETLNKITEQKPWFFEIRKKRFYKNNLKACRHTLKQLEAQKVSLKTDYQYLAGLTTEAKIEFEQKQVEYSQWKKLAKDRQDRLLREKSLQENKVETIKRGINTLRPLDLKVGYQQLQLMDPWFTEKYRRAQSRLFIHALGVRKQFLYENRVQLRKAVKVWKNQNKYRLDSPKLINNAWNWINLAIPAISSTFASFGSMFRNVDANTIGNLFIDEAGQATPQSAVGAILRSKRIMAVGDPEQIKPVITLDPLVLNMLKIRFDLPEKYMTEDSSVQTLMDSASHYGFSKDNDTWIGISLRVHRRCAYPMFTIANDISYDGLMI